MLKRSFVLAVGFLFVCAPQLAGADVSFGSSRSFILSADLFSSADGAISGLLGDLSDSAPSPYGNSYGPTPFGGTEGPLSLSTTGRGAVGSDVDGLPGSRSSNASVQLTGLSFAMQDVLSITADELSVFAGASGDHGALDAAGSFGAENVVLNVLGSNISLSAGEVYDQNGLRIFYQDGFSSVTGDAAELTATAFLMIFDDFNNSGVTYNGTMALGFARAEQRTVPEPASAAVLGLLAICYRLRRPCS